MEKIQALRAFRSLVAAACIDGKISQPEMQLLVRKAKEMRLEPAEVQQALQDGREGKLPCALPFDPREFRERMNEIMDLICADGRIESQERLLLLRFAAKAGISEADLMVRLKPKLQEAQARLSGTGVVAGHPSIPVPMLEIVDEKPVTAKRVPPAPVAPPRVEPKPAPPRFDPPKREEPRPSPIGRVSEPVSGGLTRLGPAGAVTDLGNSKDGTNPSRGPIVAPGPITLGGPSPLTQPANGLSPVAAMMVKSTLIHGTVDEAVRYVQGYCGVKDPVEARKLVEQVAAEVKQTLFR